MQEPLVRHYNVDARTFWSEVKALPDYLRRHGAELVSEDSIYLNHILTYVRTGRFPGLNNALLRELGKELRFYPGLPQFFAAVKDRIRNNSVFQRHDIRIEHHIVSTGLRQMILGTAIAPYVDGVWGCEFVEHLPEPGFLTNGREIPADQPHVIRDIAYVLDNTTKTRAIFEINKGVNKFPEIDVNSNILGMIGASRSRIWFILRMDQVMCRFSSWSTKTAAGHLRSMRAVRYRDLRKPWSSAPGEGTRIRRGKL